MSARFIIIYCLYCIVLIQAGSSSDSYQDCINLELHSVSVATFDREKKHYYYQPLFLLNSSKKNYFLGEAFEAIDLGPLSIFVLQKKYHTSENDEKIFFEYHDPEQRADQLGSIKYDDEMERWYYDKTFIEDTFPVVSYETKEFTSMYEASWRRQEISRPALEIAEWLLAVDILNFDSINRKYYYEQLFSEGNESGNLLRLRYPLLRELNLGPRDEFAVRMRRLRHDTEINMLCFLNDPEDSERLLRMGQLEFDTQRRLWRHSNVYE